MLQLQPKLTDWKTKNLVTIVISMDDPKELRRLFSERKIDAIPLYDAKGTAAQLYGVVGIPADFMINRRGELEKQFVGWDQNRSLKEIEAWILKP